MSTKTKRYFLASYTGKGYVDFFKQTVDSLDYMYVLKSVPGNGRTNLLENIAAHFLAIGEEVDFIHRPTKADALHGIILRTRNLGIIDGTAPTVLEPILPYIDGEYVDLTQAVTSSQLEENKDKIRQLKKQQTDHYEQYTKTRAKIHSLHDDMEEFYSGQLDIPAANKLAMNMIESIFGTSIKDKVSTIEKRFFEANRDSDRIDFVEELTKECHKRYFITGGPGTGKSVLMKKISAAAIERGYDIEHYHCGLEPDSLDLIIIRELGFAAFDSTPPHERQPNREGDQVVDMSDLLKIDPRDYYEAEIQAVNTTSEKIMQQNKRHLEKAEQAEKKIGQLYGAAIDPEKMKEIERKLLERIKNKA